MRQCEGGESESDVEEEHDEEGALEEEKEERSQLQLEMQHNDEPPKQPGGRSKRERKSVDRCNPQVEGRSDKEKKASGSGKKRRQAWRFPCYCT